MNSSLLLSNWGKKFGKKLMKSRLKPLPADDKIQKKWNIVRGDQVQVIEGPEIGKKGIVLNILRETCRVIVDGVNMVNKSIDISIFFHIIEYCTY